MQIEDYLIFDECLEAKIDTLAYQYYNDEDFDYLLYLPFEEMRDTMADDIFEELKEELKTTFDESKKEEIIEKIIELKIGSERLYERN